MIVRISRGQFRPDQSEVIDALLRESSVLLIPAMRRLNSNLHDDAGIERTSGTMVNVSVWTSLETALQMPTLPEMRALAERFTAEGVSFEPIVNDDTLLEITG
jgi:hypothetical protein